MSTSSSNPLSDDLQVLAAGYVLGDLSSEEMADFQARMATDATLAQTVADLQSTLTMLPYGLQQQQPDAHLRQRLLRTVQTNTARRQRRRVPHPWGTNAASVIATVLGGTSLFLWFQNTHLNLKLAAAESVIEHLETLTVASLPSSALTISPAETGITTRWYAGLSELIQDHNTALRVSADNSEAGRSKVSPIPQAMPTLATEQAALLSSSPCNFGKAQGFRATYRLSEQTVVSVYRIDLQGEQFPQLPLTQVTLRQDGTSLVLWKEENYLYALTGSLEITDLQTLTDALNFI